MPDLLLENSFKGIIAGVDEAGRGPWAGPVVAAAVILDRKNIPHGLNDSKKLSRKKREKLKEEICKTCNVGVGIVSEQEIDSLNILEATKQAMIMAVETLSTKPDVVLVDGNQKPDMNYKVEAIVKGDSKSLSIAAASIIAKVTRDEIMTELHTMFPYYGWNRNAGYGTKEHQETLEKFGITPHHRKSFAPIKKLMKA